MAAGYLVAAVLWGESIGAPAAGRRSATLDSYGEFFLTRVAVLAVPAVGRVRLDSGCSRSAPFDSRDGLAGPARRVGAPSSRCRCCTRCSARSCCCCTAGRRPAGRWMAFVWGPPLVPSLRPHDRRADRDDGPRIDGRRPRMVEPARGLAGIYAAAWMVIAVAAVYGRLWVDWAITVPPVDGVHRRRWLGRHRRRAASSPGNSVDRRPPRRRAARPRLKEIVARWRRSSSSPGC